MTGYFCSLFPQVYYCKNAEMNLWLLKKIHLVLRMCFQRRDEQVNEYKHFSTSKCVAKFISEKCEMIYFLSNSALKCLFPHTLWLWVMVAGRKNQHLAVLKAAPHTTRCTLWIITSIHVVPQETCPPSRRLIGFPSGERSNLGKEKSLGWAGVWTILNFTDENSIPSTWLIPSPPKSCAWETELNSKRHVRWTTGLSDLGSEVSRGLLPAHLPAGLWDRSSHPASLGAMSGVSNILYT